MCTYPKPLKACGIMLSSGHGTIMLKSDHFSTQNAPAKLRIPKSATMEFQPFRVF